MKQPPHSSRYLLFVGLGSAIALITIIALITFVLFGSSKRKDVDSSADNTAASTVASGEQIKNNINDAGTALKQSEADQSAVQSAIKDNEKQIKVGS